MKWRRAVAATVLLAVPVWVFAQVVANDGTQVGRLGNQTAGMGVAGLVRGDTSLKLITLDASGNLKMVDADRDRDNFSVSTNAINDTMTVGLTTVAYGNGANAGFTAESTSVLTSYPYRRFALALRAIPAGGDTTTPIRLAVQVRGHLSASADSSNTFVWYPWAVAGPVAATNIDSLGHKTSGVFTSTVSGYSPVWSGEFLVHFDPKRGYGHLGYGQSFGNPTGALILLTGPRGENFWAPYMSVRVRCLQGAAKPRVILNVIMGS